MEGPLDPIKDCNAQLVAHCHSLLTTFSTLFKLTEGMWLSKYTSASGKRHERFFRISADLKHIHWRTAPSASKSKAIEICKILSLSPGKSHFSFRKGNARIPEDPDECCFSLSTEERSYHLVCPDETTRDFWLTGVNWLVTGESTTSQALDDLETRCSLELELLQDRFVRLQTRKDKDKQKYRGYRESIKENYTKLETENKQLKQDFEVTNKALGESRTRNDELTSELDYNRTSIREHENSFKTHLSSEKHKQNEYALSLESKLTEKDHAYMQLDNEYREFKRQIKDSFSTQLVEKVKQYRRSKEVMCEYVDELKLEKEELEKELALWQAVVFHYVLPSFQAKKHGEIPTLRDVLNHALDSLEEKFNMERGHKEFVSVLTQTRKGIAQKF